MKIKEGSPQPIDCPKCKCKNGYMITKVEQLHSDSCFDKNGKYETQRDSEYRKVIRKLLTITCPECLSKLPFLIES